MKLTYNGTYGSGRRSTPGDEVKRVLDELIGVTYKTQEEILRKYSISLIQQAKSFREGGREDIASGLEIGAKKLVSVAEKIKDVKEKLKI